VAAVGGLERDRLSVFIWLRLDKAPFFVAESSLSIKTSEPGRTQVYGTNGERKFSTWGAAENEISSGLYQFLVPVRFSRKLGQRFGVFQGRRKFMRQPHLDICFDVGRLIPFRRLFLGAGRRLPGEGMRFL